MWSRHHGDPPKSTQRFAVPVVAFLWMLYVDLTFWAYAFCKGAFVSQKDVRGWGHHQV